MVHPKQNNYIAMNSIYPRPEKKSRKSTNKLTIDFDDVYGTIFQDNWALMSKLVERGSPFKFLVSNLCDHFGITEEEFKSSSRKREFATPRLYYGYISMYVIKRLISDTMFATMRTLSDPIARPHELIVHYSSQFTDLFDSDAKFRSEVKEFCLSKYDTEFWAEVKSCLLKSGVRNLT